MDSVCRSTYMRWNDLWILSIWDGMMCGSYLYEVEWCVEYWSEVSRWLCQVVKWSRNWKPSHKPAKEDCSNHMNGNAAREVRCEMVSEEREPGDLAHCDATWFKCVQLPYIRRQRGINVNGRWFSRELMSTNIWTWILNFRKLPFFRLLKGERSFLNTFVHSESEV